MDKALMVGTAVSVGMELLNKGPLQGSTDGIKRAVLGLLCLGGALAYGLGTGTLSPASLASLAGSADLVFTAAEVAVGAIVTWVGFFRQGRGLPIGGDVDQALASQRTAAALLEEAGQRRLF